MTLSQNELDKLECILSTMRDDGYPVEMQTKYSGRGMYGKECIGFVVPDVHIFLLYFGFLLSEHKEDLEIDIGELLGAIRTDNMGKSDMIVYFPEIRVDHELVDIEHGE